MPVDLYVGGAEHAVLHLLYARFWHKVLFDIGVVSTPEPFQKLVHQGMILGEDGQKMSKSLRQRRQPRRHHRRSYGADALRLYEMFMGPLEAIEAVEHARASRASRASSTASWRLFVDEDGALERVTADDAPSRGRAARAAPDDRARSPRTSRRSSSTPRSRR